MSDKETIEDPIHEQIRKRAEVETLKQKVQDDELLIRARSALNKLKQIQENDKNTEIAKTINYGQMSMDEIDKVRKENRDYMESARNKMRFMNKDFDNIVPFFRKNLILVAGRTGDGKSTTVANIIRETIRNTHPDTKKLRRVLVITNEERVEDVFNRVTCLIKGWDYRNHDKFTKEQIDEFDKYIVSLSRMITVIDNNHGGAIGSTATIEGICLIFDNLIQNKEYYDAVIIDYYQNIMQSRDNPGHAPWQVQEALANKLDGYKNVYPSPIVLLAQVNPQDAEKKTPFKVRIEGRKSILNVATCCMELIANKEDRVTEWVVHKSRFNGAVGETIRTGYDKGQYVEWNDEFRAKVAEWKAKAETDALNKQVGMPAPKAIENGEDEPNE